MWDWMNNGVAAIGRPIGRALGLPGFGDDEEQPPQPVPPDLPQQKKKGPAPVDVQGQRPQVGPVSLPIQSITVPDAQPGPQPADAPRSGVGGGLTPEQLTHALVQSQYGPDAGNRQQVANRTFDELLPGRKLPTVYQNEKDIPGGGNYRSLPGGGWVRSDQVMGLGGSDNPGHIAAAMREYADQNTARMRGMTQNAPTPAMNGVQAEQLANQQFMQMIGAGGQNFQADTARGAASADSRAKEYGLKVRGPEEDVTKLAQSELENQGREQVARINQKAASQQAINQQILQLQSDGKLRTPKEVQDAIARTKGLNEEMQGTTPPLPPAGFVGQARQRAGIPVEVGPRPEIRVDGAPETGKKSLKTLTEEKSQDLTSDQVAREALQMMTGPDGKTTGKWDVGAIGKKLAGYDPALLKDDILTGVADAAGKHSGKTREEMVSDLAKEYIRQSRAAYQPPVGDRLLSGVAGAGLNKSGIDTPGVGGWKVTKKTPLKGFLGLPTGNEFELTHPDYGTLTGRETDSPWASGTGNALDTMTNKGAADAKKQALVIERLMNMMLKQGAAPQQ